mgnify:CR=1 FL=1|uniref:hypothetical protein n=1 Tax=Enterocloster clostridioformis TaxID=1531 RepID=UPI00042681AA|nr:hypothetical protein [Enterocloster clostridioformis]
MEIKKPAVAGTLESSDCQVTVEAGEGTIDFTLESAVINQYCRLRRLKNCAILPIPLPGSRKRSSLRTEWLVLSKAVTGPLWMWCAGLSHFSLRKVRYFKSRGNGTIDIYCV